MLYYYSCVLSAVNDVVSAVYKVVSVDILNVTQQVGEAMSFIALVLQSVSAPKEPSTVYFSPIYII